MLAADRGALLLGIESSCDDTAAAVTEGNSVLSHIVSGQSVHGEYGGIVPELASRAHQRNIVPVVDAALHRAKVGLSSIDGIAFTQGPGLPGSLHVGVAFAKSLALSYKLPLYPVHHLQAHVLSHFIEQDEGPPLPFLCATVSGGHTQLVLMRSMEDMELIGRTRDDAAGEAFDKTARTLGLPYPGGPMIDRYAKGGDPEAFSFPEAGIEGYDMSFSGLKTAVLYRVKALQKEGYRLEGKLLCDLCASVQDAVASHLLGKIKKGIRGKAPAAVGLAGGVAANSHLRTRFSALAEEKGIPGYIPPFTYCTDNAAMIGITGAYSHHKGLVSGQEVTPLPRTPFPSTERSGGTFRT
ncbi:MAG: tRNA (adenosine(37)-N6)-threonylcarbamoyltransferase complex transferase subunit TsaD [Flavobacteriales bacterium]